MTKIKEIIEAAVRGGYGGNIIEVVEDKPQYKTIKLTVCESSGVEYDKEFDYSLFFMDPDFWKALGKECGWVEDMHDEGMWLDNATEFHRINLTEGLSSAIEWLSALTGKE